MAGLVRRAHVRSTPAFCFENLESQGRAIIDKARREAAEIVERAEREAHKRAEHIEAEARRHGAESGREDGFQQARKDATKKALGEARAELAALAQSLSEGLRVFDENKQRLLAQAECGLIHLALSIARRVCKHDVGESSKSALENARAVVEIAKHEHDLRLHLNSADHDLLREGLPQALAAVDGLGHVEVVADQSVERGGCVLRSRDGVIDASIDTQLERVAQALVQINKPDDPPTV